MTQAERLIKALRTRWMTAAEIQALRISTCHHKRLAESGHKYLRPGEFIDKRLGADGLLRLRVVKS